LNLIQQSTTKTFPPCYNKDASRHRRIGAIDRSRCAVSRSLVCVTIALRWPM